MLRGKRGKLFWFSSLGQMIQFGTIKFHRPFRNCFGPLNSMDENRILPENLIHSDDLTRIEEKIAILLCDNATCHENF